MRVPVRPLTRPLAWLSGVAALALALAVPALSDTLAQSNQAQRGEVSGDNGANPLPLTQSANPNAAMVVRAREMIYNNDSSSVTANGDVQIYYDGRILQADRIVYDRKSGRVRAQGDVRITESDGSVTTAQSFDLTDDFRDGFIDSLHRVTPLDTRLAASRGERLAGDVIVFDNGVYTACLPCRDHPEKPPTWQIKAKRVIEKQQEKTIYFEDASFELLGVPIAYVPFFSAADPTVKRKSGLLAPTYFSSGNIGYGATFPYFYALSPSADITVAPGFTTKQGPFGTLEYRQRLLTGSYRVRAAGVFQLDPNTFTEEEARGDFRGTVDSQGEFNINRNWLWGWDVTAVTDKYFRDDYSIDPSRITEAISTLYLTGIGTRSWFDTRLYYFEGLTTNDVQKQLPIVLPVLDYNYIVDHPVAGGELGYDLNVTNLTREQAAFQQIAGFANPLVNCDGTSIITTPRADCIQRGIDGDYARASFDVYWKKTFTDPAGQQWTPFAYLRGDVAGVDLDTANAPVQFADDGTQARGIGAVGLEYRYPFVDHESWGKQVIEPIAQVILRPGLAQTGQLPNEDAQSLVYDDTNLFEWDKFSGYDRIEDGSRVNVGLQYTLTTNNGGYYNALFGQSYVLFDQNPYADPDMTNLGLQTGLDTDVSDYVARVQAQPIPELAFSSSARFDQDDFSLRRLEVSAIGTVGPLQGDVAYGDYDAQPALGLARRQGVQGTGSLKVADHWIASGGALYDVDAERFASRYVGLSYLDECIAAGFRVARDYSDSDLREVTKVSFQLTLRTLGDSGTPSEFQANQRRKISGFERDTPYP